MQKKWLKCSIFEYGVLQALLSCYLLYAGSLYGYTPQQLEKFALRGRAYVESMLSHRRLAGDTDAIRQLEQLIAERFSQKTALKSDEIALKRAPVGQSYILVPTTEAEKRARGEFKSQITDLPASTTTSAQMPTLTQEPIQTLSQSLSKKPIFLKKGGQKPEELKSETTVSYTPLSVLTQSKKEMLSETKEQIEKPSPEKRAEIPEAPPLKVPLAPPPPAPPIPGAPPAPAIPGAPPAPLAPQVPGVKKPGVFVAGKPGEGQKQEKRKALSEEDRAKLTIVQKEISDLVLVQELQLLSGVPKEGPGKVSKEAVDRAKSLSQYFNKFIKTGFDNLLDNQAFVHAFELERIKSRLWDALIRDVEKIVSQEKTYEQAYQLFETQVTRGVELFKPLVFDWERYSNQVTDYIRFIVLHAICLSRSDQAQDQYQENDSDLVAISVLLEAPSYTTLIQNLNRLIIHIDFKRYQNLFKLPTKEASEAAASRFNIAKTFSDTSLLEKRGVVGYVGSLVDVIEKELLFFSFGVEEKEQVSNNLVVLFTNYKDTLADMPGKDVTAKSALSYDELFQKYCSSVENLKELIIALEYRVKKESRGDEDSQKKLVSLITMFKQAPENQEAIMALFEQLFIDQQNRNFVNNIYKKYQVNLEIFRILKEIMKEVTKAMGKVKGLRPEEAKNIIETSLYQGKKLYDRMPDRDSVSFATIAQEFNALKRDPRKLFALYKKLYLDQVASADELSKSGVSADNFIYMLEPYGALLSIIDDFNQTKIYKHLINDLTVLNTGIRKNDDIAKEEVAEEQSNLSKLLRVKSGTIATDILERGLYKSFLSPVIVAVEQYDMHVFEAEVNKLVSIAQMGVENSKEYTDLLDKAGLLILDQGYIDSIQKLKNFMFDIDIKTGVATGIGAREALSIKGAIQKKMSVVLAPLVTYLQKHVLRQSGSGIPKEQIQFFELYQLFLEKIVPALIVVIKKGFEYQHIIVTDELIYALAKSMIGQLELKIIAVLRSIYIQAGNDPEQEAQEYQLFQQKLSDIFTSHMGGIERAPDISDVDKKLLEKRYHTAQELLRILYNQENMTLSLRKNLRRIFEQYEKSDIFQDTSLWVQEHFASDHRSASDIINTIFTYLMSNDIDNALLVVSKAFGGSRAIGVDFTYADFMRKEESGKESRWNLLLKQMIQDNKFQYLENDVPVDLLKKDQELLAARAEKARILKEQEEKERETREQEEKAQKEREEKELEEEKAEKERLKKERQTQRELVRKKGGKLESEQAFVLQKEEVLEALKVGHAAISGLIEQASKEKAFPKNELQKFEILHKRLEKLLKSGVFTEKDIADIATLVNEYVSEFDVWKRKQKPELIEE